MTRRAWLVWTLCLGLLVGCSARQSQLEVAPPPPVPPSEPLAWMPADTTLLGHADVTTFRSTPIWDFWNDLQRGPHPLPLWIDEALVDDVTFSGRGLDAQPSFVGVAK